jgi:hypothetical protein
MAVINWPPQIGDEVSRGDVCDTVKGSLQGGITSCNGGTTGNQSIERGNNKALLNAHQSGKPIHLFSETAPDSALHRYLGCVILADPPYRWDRAPDVNGDERDVVVFTFVPTKGNEIFPDTPNATKSVSAVTWTPPASEGFERSAIAGGRSAREEHKLQAKFGAWLQQQGHVVKRVLIPVSGSSALLEPDFIDETDGLVIEAKVSGARGFVRTAIGQVLDYQHLLSNQGYNYSPAILLPFTPSPDLVDLLASLEITLIVQQADRFIYIKHQN